MSHNKCQYQFNICVWKHLTLITGFWFITRLCFLVLTLCFFASGPSTCFKEIGQRSRNQASSSGWSTSRGLRRLPGRWYNPSGGIQLPCNWKRHWELKQKVMQSIHFIVSTKEENIHTGRVARFDGGAVVAIIAEVGWFLSVDTLDAHLVGLSGFLQLG